VPGRGPQVAGPSTFLPLPPRETHTLTDNGQNSRRSCLQTPAPRRPCLAQPLASTRRWLGEAGGEENPEAANGAVLAEGEEEAELKVEASPQEGVSVQ
jgi:hypothetical protein